MARFPVTASAIPGLIVFLLLTAAIAGWVGYSVCLIDVPNQHIAILIHKVGKDLENNDILAPTEEYKGMQQHVLTEGRYYYNPYEWEWNVVPQIEIPAGKLGVRVRMYGNDLPPGELIAWKDDPQHVQKGILPEVLNAGRYAINARIVSEGERGQSGAYAELIELHDPVTIPAGFKGVVTLLAAPMPEKTNEVISEKDRRGVQPETLEPGTYYFNPYLKRVSQVDCRSQKFNLTDIGFPTKDGFWVSLEAIIEFRINPEKVPLVFVLYNTERNGERLKEEIVNTIILPNARAYTRLRGSNNSGKEFITGDTRARFQEDFQKQMSTACAAQGIEVIQALITNINPPEKIATPVRARQIAVQEEARYKKEIEQQQAEQDLAVQKATVEQKKAQVVADQEVVAVTVEAQKKQEVALIEASKRLGVAQQKLEAAKDLAAATLAKGKAEADVVRFANEAQAAGWQKAIEAFNGDGAEFARYTLLKKIAPAYKSLMLNTENSSLMDVFRSYQSAAPAKKPEPKK